VAGEARLFEVLAHPEWTLIGDGAVDGARSFVDSDGRVRAAYGAAFVLIRPDGYVALLADEPAGLPSSVYDLLTRVVA
jgi:hypothetical protein